jgi:hypothetical protein
MSLPAKLGTSVVGSSVVNFHYGNTMLKLAQTYISLHEAVLEAVQNSIDSNATKIQITIDRKKRGILIMDNGDGVIRSIFEEALNRVCSTMKTKDKLGEFGLGLISMLGKCKSFSFTSCAKDGDEGYQEWTFETEDIARQSKAIEVPYRKRPYVYEANMEKPKPLPKGMQAVNWRTCVRVRDYVEDRQISRIQSAEALKEAILDKYGVAMRRNDVSVAVHIVNENGTSEHASGKAKRFSGKKLPEVVISDKDAGMVTFRMHLARKGNFGFKGRVLIGISHDDFRLPFSIFAKEATDLLSDDIVGLFKSGIFEGEIIVQNTKLHDSRKTFVNNDAYVGFCVALEKWFLEHGKKYLKDAKEEREDTRIQNLTLKCVQTFEALLKDPSFERFQKETIGAFNKAMVGAGQKDPDDNLIGTDNDPLVRTAGKTRSAKDSSSAVDGKPTTARQGRAPFTAAGPDGASQTQAKGNPRGLQFKHVAMRTDGPPWTLEPESATVYFNVAHPEWVAASKAGDRELMQWQEIGALMVLVEFTMPEEYRSASQLFAEEFVAPLSFLIRKSPSFNLNARIKGGKA